MPTRSMRQRQPDLKIIHSHLKSFFGKGKHKEKRKKRQSLVDIFDKNN